jgi:hypothetical protein
MEPGYTYRVDNQELIDLVREDFYSDPKLIRENRGKQHYQKYLGTLEKNDVWGWNKWAPKFWNERPDLYHYLNDITYPRDPEYFVDKTWMKYYPKDTFSSLHQDEVEPNEALHEDRHVNVILIDQDPDIVGGIIVIAGDAYEPNFKDPNEKYNLRERLLTRFLKTPGDAITWSEIAMHGVSKIEHGHRLVLVCSKIKMERQNG